MAIGPAVTGASESYAESRPCCVRREAGSTWLRCVDGCVVGAIFGALAAAFPAFTRQSAKSDNGFQNRRK
jgi:hypothetical protein